MFGARLPRRGSSIVWLGSDAERISWSPIGGRRSAHFLFYRTRQDDRTRFRGIARGVHGMDKTVYPAVSTSRTEEARLVEGARNHPTQPGRESREVKPMGGADHAVGSQTGGVQWHARTNPVRPNACDRVYRRRARSRRPLACPSRVPAVTKQARTDAPGPLNLG